MRNKLTFAAIAAGILAFASTSAFAVNSLSAPITITADVPSTDNLTCDSTSVDFGSVAPGQSSDLKTLPCHVTTNDTLGVTLSVYVEGDNALTGTASASNVLAAGNLKAGKTSSNLASLSGASTGNVTGNGLDINSFDSSASAQDQTVYLQLNIPTSQNMDHYTGTLNVVITPNSI